MNPLEAASSDLNVAAAAQQVAAPIRNVILVTLDTLRADHVGLYGYPRPTTPNLDQFAQHAVVFSRAIAQASSTTPSHRALFQSLPASATTRDGLPLADVLANSGFRTAAFTGGANISHKLGFGRGFEEIEEGDGGFSESLPQAAAWIRAHRAERFFVFLHSYDIHLPYDPPEPHASMFTETYEGPVRGDNTRPTLRRIRSMRQDEGATVDLDASDRERIMALYDGGIHYTDHQLKHLFDLAVELDLFADTLFVVFSDHGEEFWDHGSVIHSHSLFQELLHVPLIFRVPGRAPARIETTVALMDVSPTILELLGISVLEQFQGHSLTGLIAGTESDHRPVISEQKRLKSWMEYPWKVIRGEDTSEFQLFDLSADPGEHNDIAGSQTEITKRMGASIAARLAGYDNREVLELEPGIEDPEHIERLRALGYID